MSASLAAPALPASVYDYGEITVLWDGAGNYKGITFGFGGSLWQRTSALEGSYDTKYLTLPVDVLSAPFGEGDGPVSVSVGYHSR